MPKGKRTPTNGYYALRWLVLKRDNFTCQYCGQSAPNVKLEVDHVLPVSEGGPDAPDNLVTSCWACNRGKSALSIIVHRRKDKTKPICTPVLEPTKTPSDTANVLSYIQRTQKQLTAADIALGTNLPTPSVRVILHRLLDRGLITHRNKNLWEVA